MNDLIKREDVLTKIDEFVKLNAACGFPVDVFDIEMMKKMIGKIPVEDVAPVVHGHWIICSDGYCPYCSRCKEEPTSRKMTKFCDHCGAKMDEED